MKSLRPLRAVALWALALVSTRAADSSPLPDGLYAEFTTPRGTFTTELYFTRAPLMCANFVSLAEGTRESRNGKPVYTGLTWYRVVPGFVMQSGNPGLRDTADLPTPVTPHFPDEFVPGLGRDAAGILPMANAGPDTNSCEFFLTLAPTPRLNYLHSVFGRTVRGLEILPQIRQDDAVSIKILRVGPAAKTFTACREPSATAHFDDPQNLLPLSPPRAKLLNYKLANFERATGVRIVARLLAQSPPDTVGRKLNAYLRNLAEKLDVLQTGALVLYVADRARKSAAPPESQPIEQLRLNLIAGAVVDKLFLIQLPIGSRLLSSREQDQGRPAG